MAFLFVANVRRLAVAKKVYRKPRSSAEECEDANLPVGRHEPGRVWTIWGLK
jgi:hypothetical protein